MRDPFTTLGLPPTADVADAEAAFRRELKRCHPDRHIGAPAPVLSDAERRTRELTEAIRAVRAGWRPEAAGADTDPASWQWRHGFRESPDHDWFGTPLHDDERASACPLCGAPVDGSIGLELHFHAEHRRPRRPPNRFAHWLRFLPAPSLSLLVVLVLWWVVVVELAPPTIERIGIWIGVAGFLVLRGMVHHAQRHRL